MRIQYIENYDDFLNKLEELAEDLYIEVKTEKVWIKEKERERFKQLYSYILYRDMQVKKPKKSNLFLKTIWILLTSLKDINKFLFMIVHWLAYCSKKFFFLLFVEKKKAELN